MELEATRNLFMAYIQVEEDDRTITFEEFEKVVEVLQGNEEFEQEARSTCAPLLKTKPKTLGNFSGT